MNLDISKLKPKNEKRQVASDPKKNGQTNNSEGNKFKCDTGGKPHKTEDCWNATNSANDPRPRRHNQQEQKIDNFVQPMTSKTDDESKN